MANKICVIPLLDKAVEKNEQIQNLAARCVASFGSSRRGKHWYESVEWNVIASSENVGPNIRFEPLKDFEKLKKLIEKESGELQSKEKVQDVKKMVMTALSLPWNDDGLFSPVKRNPALTSASKRPAAPLKLILLLGSATGDSPVSILNSQIQKMLNSMEIQILHVAQKSHFTSIQFVNSNLPLTKRLFDPLCRSLQRISVSPVPQTTPECLSAGLVRLGPVEYPVRLHAREKISFIEIKAEMGPDVLGRILPFLSADSSTAGLLDASFPAHAIGKLFLGTINRTGPALLSVKKIGAKISLGVRTISGPVDLGPEKSGPEPKSGSILHAAFQPTQERSEAVKGIKTAADQSKVGTCGFLRDQLDQIGKLSRKNGISHRNILPTKLRVRSTPTKTPMKENIMTPRRTPNTPKQNNATPLNENRELKRLSRMVPDSVSGLWDSIKASLKYRSFVTMARVCDNFVKKHKCPLKELRSTKAEIIEKFGGTEMLKVQIKTQLILYLSEGEDQFEKDDFVELCLLFRWFSFICSSVEMNGFFEEEVIPVWLENDSKISIHRIILVYDELFLNVPKSLSSFSKGDDSSEEDDEGDESNNDDVVTLGPSSVSNSIPSSMFSMFSNNSTKFDESQNRGIKPEPSRRITSNAQRRISVGVTQRRQSEPVKSFERSNSTSSNTHRNSQFVGKKPDRAKRALFSSPDRNQPETSTTLRRTKTLRTNIVKDTPSKSQTMTKNQRVKERVKRRRTESKSGISVIGESPERKTKFTAANPEVTFNTDQFKLNSKTLQKVISVDESQFNRSSLDFFSPPKNPDSLLFGSGSSSEDELVSRSSLKSSSGLNLISRSVSLVMESPIKVDENCENFSKTSGVRRSLLSNFSSRNSPRLSGRHLTPTSSQNLASQAPLAQKDPNSLADIDVFNDSFEALEKGTILTPKHDRPTKSHVTRNVRRQLKLSESED